jgi:hypothetical protein
LLNFLADDPDLIFDQWFIRLARTNQQGYQDERIKIRKNFRTPMSVLSVAKLRETTIMNKRGGKKTNDHALFAIDAPGWLTCPANCSLLRAHVQQFGGRRELAWVFSEG